MSSSITCRILYPSVTTFMNILTNKKNPRVFIHFWYQNNMIRIYQNLLLSNTKESLSKQGDYLTTEEYLGEIMTLFVKP